MRTQEQDTRVGSRITGVSVGTPGTTLAPGVVVVKGAVGVYTLYFTNYRALRSAIVSALGNAIYTAVLITQPNVVQVNVWNSAQAAVDLSFVLTVDGISR
jgi:hypothetical protein